MGAVVHAETRSGAHLCAHGRMVLWTELDEIAPDSRQIVATSGDRRRILARGIVLGAGAGLTATAGYVVWFDGGALGLVDTAGAVRHCREPGLPWVTHLAAGPARVVLARGDDAQHQRSVIARLDLERAATTTIAKIAGRVEQLVVAGDHVAWTCGDGDVFAQPIAGGMPAIVYSGDQPFVMAGAHDQLVIATGQELVRVACASGDSVAVASDLAAGAPRMVACSGEHAYIARDHGVERVELASGAATLVHAGAVAGLVAADDGAYVLDHAARIFHIPGDAASLPAPELEVDVDFDDEPEDRPAPAVVTELSLDELSDAVPMPPDPAIAIESAGGRLRARFAAEPASCLALVRRIVADAPRRVDLACERASPGERFSSALRGQALGSVRAFVCDGSPEASPGAIAGVLAAMPALERAYVAGALALEPLAHAALRELHLASGKLEPAFASALGASQLPRLERCALAFAKISTAGLLGVVRALVKLRAPALRELHVGGLRGPDQIRDVVDQLAARGRPESWTTVSFDGAFGDGEQLAAVLDTLVPPPGLQLAVPAGAAATRRPKKWLVELAWAPCDPRAW